MKPEIRQRSTDARKKILARVSAANQKRTGNNAAPSGNNSLPADVQTHLASRPSHTLPSWPAMGDDTERLIEQMEQVQITVTRVQTQREVAQVVDEYRREHGIDGPLIVSPALQGNGSDTGIEWPEATQFGAARDALPATRNSEKTEITSVTPCFCAVAETGSIVTASDAARPSTLNFLPDNHMVVLHENQIVRHVDDVWQEVRSKSTVLTATTTDVPRAVNFITGPSRTADIEQTLELGAHGPRRMHVILVAADSQQESQ